VAEIEKLADGFTANKSSSAIKKDIVKGIPQQAVLKPEYTPAEWRRKMARIGTTETIQFCG
jgi:Exoribonuclease 1 Domain-3